MAEHTKMPETDLLGRPLDEVERELVAIHQRLESLAGREGLAPCVSRGTRAALAVTWQMLNDLNLGPEHPEDIREG